MNNSNDDLLNEFNDFVDDDLFMAVVDDMHALYKNTISNDEAFEAARNLIGLCKILLEIHTQEK